MSQQDHFEEAVSRVNYRLTFARTDKPRRFDRESLDGPPVPHAVTPEEVFIGEWCQYPDGAPDEMTVDEWLEHFLSMAVNDAVHEVLEYFQVDGEQYLDPHGAHASQIFKFVNEMAANLANLARSDSDAK